MNEPNFQEILKSKIDYYGQTEAAYQFAAEEYARQLVGGPTICFLSNSNNGEKKQYAGITYTKENGINGYLCVEGKEVQFIYSDQRGVVMDVLDYYEVSYEKINI